MKYDFDKPIDRSGTFTIKHNTRFLKEMRQVDVKEDSIMLWLADMDFAAPPKIIEAIKKRADHGVLGYTTHYFYDEYFDSVASWHNRRHNRNIKNDELVFTPTVLAALDKLVKTLTKPGENVIIQPPVYPPFARIIRENKRRVAENTLVESDGYYEIDFEGLGKKASDPETKAMIFCNPHNPVGRVWTETELRKVIDICTENQVYLISDEIHCDLLRCSSKHIAVDALSDNKDLVVCTATNKTFNTAGLHCAHTRFRNPELKSAFVAAVGMSSPTPFGIEAVMTGYNECEDWLREVCEYIDKNLHYLNRFIFDNLPEIRFVKPEGTYLAWLDFRGFGLTEEQCFRKMAEEAGVVLQKGSEFGKSGEGYFRLNFATQRANLEKALAQIARSF